MPEAPFTEPVPIPCLFISGTACEFLAGFVRIVAHVTLPNLPDEPHERRIVGRWVLPENVARALQRELQKGLRKTGH
jgi:hypothetical protein